MQKIAKKWLLVFFDQIGCFFEYFFKKLSKQKRFENIFRNLFRRGPNRSKKKQPKIDFQKVAKITLFPTFPKLFSKRFCLDTKFSEKIFFKAILLYRKRQRINEKSKYQRTELFKTSKNTSKKARICVFPSDSSPVSPNHLY